MSSSAATGFVNVGERTNVTGSARFRKLITAGDYAAALDVARDQVANGAQVLDVNMDEGLLDSEEAMATFLNLIAAEPDIARVPIMIDSSKWSVIEAGPEMRSGQGDRQFDLDEGRRGRRSASSAETGAPLRRRRGGHGLRREGPGRYAQAQDRDLRPRLQDPDAKRSASRRKTSSSIPMSSRSPPASRSTTITASISSRRSRWIKANLPHAHVSGGVSNLSFSFRGNETVRGAMHAVFLYHAIAAGMDMGIVNAGALPVYDEIEPELRELCEDVVLNRRADATERLLEAAERYRADGGEKKVADVAWRALPVDKRLEHALVHGITQYIVDDTEEARLAASPAARRDRRAADGRHERGRRPLRRGQDVPAPGGQVGAGDEAGGRPSAALHGGGQAPPRRRGPAGGAHPARHRQGRRPRHRQEHRRRRARLQQLRGHRPRRHGAGGRRSWRRRRRKRSTSSACPA